MFYLREEIPVGWAGSYDPVGLTVSPSSILDREHHGFAQDRRYGLGVRGCDGICTAFISAPGLTMYNCANPSREVRVDDLKHWPKLNNKEYILFEANFLKSFYNEPR